MQSNLPFPLFAGKATGFKEDREGHRTPLASYKGSQKRRAKSEVAREVTSELTLDLDL